MIPCTYLELAASIHGVEQSQGGSDSGLGTQNPAFTFPVQARGSSPGSAGRPAAHRAQPCAPRVGDPPPAHPACQGWGLLQGRASPSPRGCPLPGDVPAEARSPLARCSPAAGAHRPVPRCRVSHPGAPGSEEEIPGGRNRLRGRSLHVPSGQALPRCVGPNPGLGACPRLPWGHQGPPARWQPGCHFPVPIFTCLDPPGVTWPKPREPNPTLRNPFLLRLCTMPTL